MTPTTWTRLALGLTLSAALIGCGETAPTNTETTPATNAAPAASAPGGSAPATSGPAMSAPAASDTKPADTATPAPAPADDKKEDKK